MTERYPEAEIAHSLAEEPAGAADPAGSGGPANPPAPDPITDAPRGESPGDANADPAAEG